MRKRAHPPEFNSACHRGIAKVSKDLPEAGKPVGASESIIQKSHSFIQLLIHGTRGLGTHNGAGHCKHTGIAIGPTQWLLLAFRESKAGTEIKAMTAQTAAWSGCPLGRALPGFSDVMGTEMFMQSPQRPADPKHSVCSCPHADSLWME